jgi:hypothetical protein
MSPPSFPLLARASHVRTRDRLQCCPPRLSHPRPAGQGRRLGRSQHGSGRAGATFPATKLEPPSSPYLDLDGYSGPAKRLLSVACLGRWLAAIRGQRSKHGAEIPDSQSSPWSDGSHHVKMGLNRRICSVSVMAQRGKWLWHIRHAATYPSTTPMDLVLWTFATCRAPASSEVVLSKCSQQEWSMSQSRMTEPASVRCWSLEQSSASRTSVVQSSRTSRMGDAVWDYRGVLVQPYVQ